jgi:hypothetical protein
MDTNGKLTGFNEASHAEIVSEPTGSVARSRCRLAEQWQSSRGTITARVIARRFAAIATLGPAVALAQPLPTVLHYDFEEGPVSTILVDSSGFDASPLPLVKYTTSGVGTLSYSADVPTSGDGHLYTGSSLRIGPRWSIGHAQPGANLQHELQQVTVEAWVKVPWGTPGGVVLAHVPRFAACDGRGWTLAVSSAGAGMSIGDQPAGVFFNVAAPMPLSPDQWYHIAGSYDGVTGKVFVNGVERASAAGNGAIRYDDGEGVPECGTGGPTSKTTYLGAVHNNNPTPPLLPPANNLDA